MASILLHFETDDYDTWKLAPRKTRGAPHLPDGRIGALRAKPGGHVQWKELAWSSPEAFFGWWLPTDTAPRERVMHDFAKTLAEKLDEHGFSTA